MSGRPKQGIDYAGWSVDIFDGDKKIDKASWTQKAGKASDIFLFMSESVQGKWIFL